LKNELKHIRKIKRYTIKDKPPATFTHPMAGRATPNHLI